jgi:hypothetical protein
MSLTCGYLFLSLVRCGCSAGFGQACGSESRLPLQRPRHVPPLLRSAQCFDADSTFAVAVGQQHANARISPVSGCTPITFALLSWARTSYSGMSSLGRTRARFLEFCRYLRSLYPATTRIAIVCDNFSPHLNTAKDNRIGAWAKANNVELAYTPTNSSWLNRIEAQFTALR